MNIFSKCTALACVMLCALSNTASAGIIIGGTRVVFPATSREVTVRLQNKANVPALVQAWVDAGDESSTPETAEAPFTLAPPIFRMDGGKGHSLRLIHTGETMPTDRESLYWLNVLEVPPKPKDGSAKNTLQFAFRIRIKMFYRPADLPYSANEAPSRLAWTLRNEGNNAYLEVTNPTPYYITFSDVSLVAGEVRYPKRDTGGGMVAPHQSLRFSVSAVQTAVDALRVEYKTINDYGAMVSATAALSH
ncbi:chaperone protein EcpD [Luteibacter sp. Sphag1AF]|uniref:fimbrial biogenesis chaperone n=1 Tax=Luteibacter sp. Sphag1AF TaxID=2587031 RepID=UPI001607E109|nr:fimbria/pilus periplasmic chaperone [Luteibacter sp. Sphag1AF]MBB3227644.1 chaperone protein EcpD [Luteibacter sp. Sphag1AF]